MAECKPRNKFPRSKDLEWLRNTSCLEVVTKLHPKKIQRFVHIPMLPNLATKQCCATN